MKVGYFRSVNTAPQSTWSWIEHYRMSSYTQYSHTGFWEKNHTVNSSSDLKALSEGFKGTV